MTKQKNIEQIQAEQKEVETKLTQEQHNLERLENRIKFLKKGERSKRTHHLCILGGTIEHFAPEFKNLTRSEMFGLMEYIFSLPEVKRAVHNTVLLHDEQTEGREENGNGAISHERDAN